MPPRVLHILSQRPGRTGSGVTLEAMIRQAAAAGWEQTVVIGAPVTDPTPPVGDLPPSAIRPVTFGTAAAADLDFPVPGMSDVMPYPSTIWSTLSRAQLAQYRAVWRRHLTQVIHDFQPDVIHSHHIWLVSALLKELAPHLPVVITCHSTGLRQMATLPALAGDVRHGCAQADHFCVLRSDHADLLATTLNVSRDDITVVGAGYDPTTFCRADAPPRAPQSLLYVGKYSAAKGLPWLLDACDKLRRLHPELQLHIAGDGTGPEAEGLRARMAIMSPFVTRHGQLPPAELADLMRRCQICVLPSFYEGVPLVLVEAAACGCRLVATALPGVREQINPHLAPWLTLVELPRLHGSDTPVSADLPAFTAALTSALDAALLGGGTPDPRSLAPFDWNAVFERVHTIWCMLTY